MTDDPQKLLLRLFRQSFPVEDYDGDVQSKEDDLQSVLNGDNTGWADTIPYLKKYEEEAGVDLSEAISFAEDMADPDRLETIEEKNVEEEIPERERFVIEQQVRNSESQEMMAYTDEPIGLQAINQLQENIWLGEGKKCFLISKQREWDGRIAGQLSESKKKYELMACYKDEANNYEFKHFGQGNPNKGLNKVDSMSKTFYEYKFVADDQQYMALSTEPLDPVRCKLYGTHVSLNDYKTVGENRKLPVEEDIIFVHSTEPAIEPFSLTELEELQPKVDHEYFAEHMFGVYRHPDWFEEFFMSIMSVNEDVDSYPSHLLIMAEPDTGTSTLLEASLLAFDEPQKEPFEGGASTVKGLTPSFASDPPDEGLLLKSQRVAGVDEFFDLLKNTSEQSNGNRQDAFTSMKSLLEHKKRNFSSGNGSITGQMGAQMIAATNSVYGVDNLIDAQSKLNSAVLSRFIQYEQLDSHIEYVRNNKDNIDCRYEEGLPERDDEFISLMDTLRDVVRIEVDSSKVSSIHEGLKPKVPAGFKDTFTRRHKHHIEVTVAGLAKINYFKENRDKFEAQDSDYKRAKELWEILVSSWGEIPEDEIADMSSTAKKEALGHAERRVYEVINDQPGIIGDELQSKVDVESLSWSLTQLKNYSLAASKKDDAGKTHYFPEWTDEFEKQHGEEER